MKSLQILVSTFVLITVLTLTTSLHIEINNIHHGYKTTVQGVSQVVQKSQGNAEIILTNLTWQMDQLQPELIPFLKKQGSDKVVIDLSQQLIQGVFEQENQVILLVFKQNTSIITTVTLRPHPKHPEENVSLVSSAIKANCQYSEEL